MTAYGQTMPSCVMCPVMQNEWWSEDSSCLWEIRGGVKKWHGRNQWVEESEVKNLGPHAKMYCSVERIG
ncbi:hypothetical protein AVEN_161392-1, partial [Araneus ventricosus]